MKPNTTHAIQTLVDSFLTRVNDAGQKLSRFSQSVEDRQEQIKQLLLGLKGALRPEQSQGKPGQQSQIRQLVAQSVQNYQTSISEWLELIDQHLDGKEFINQFEKSILLTVFGQVNTGKSTLGNFIAGTKYIGSGIRFGAGTPEFYIYDWADAQADRRAVLLTEGQFKENFKEETRTIQYFTLNEGLTWVDTPGIHSLTTENEDLAKKYVEYADLVLFIVPSSAPGKQSEIQELKRLVKKEKPLLVTITKSDKFIEDEVDGELVKLLLPKSDKDRTDQEQYIEKEISEHEISTFMKDRNIISFSGKLAELAIERNDAQLFEQSNAPKLYEQISRVINDHTLELKMERPRKAVNSAIREIIDGFDEQGQPSTGLNGLLASFVEVQQQLEQNKAKLKDISERVLLRLKADISMSVESKVLRLAHQFDSGQAIDQKAVTKEIEDEIVRAFNAILSEQVKKLLSDIELEQVRALHLELDAQIEGKYNTIEYVDKRVVERSRDPRGFFETIQSWFGKTFYESVVREDKKTKQVKVGNNASDVAVRMIEQVNKQLQPVVKHTVEQVTIQYFSQMEQTLARIICELKDVRDKLEQTKF